MRNFIYGDDLSMDAVRAKVTADPHWLHHEGFRTGVDDRTGVAGLNYLNIWSLSQVE